MSIYLFGLTFKYLSNSCRYHILYNPPRMTEIKARLATVSLVFSLLNFESFRDIFLENYHNKIVVYCFHTLNPLTINVPLT